ncbi:MAG: acylphosphatase [Microbacteriaceae bacterium]|jgi:acylphosphatase|nr:acylphosphatase [Microbacteriaceae bacterium]
MTRPSRRKRAYSDDNHADSVVTLRHPDDEAGRWEVFAADAFIGDEFETEPVEGAPWTHYGALKRAAKDRPGASFAIEWRADVKPILDAQFMAELTAREHGALNVVRIRAVVVGRTQGTEFRTNAGELAARLGLSGFTRNRDDGSVEVEMEGEGASADSMIAWLESGPQGELVQSVTVSNCEPLGQVEFSLTHQVNGRTQSRRRHLARSEAAVAHSARSRRRV